MISVAVRLLRTRPLIMTQAVGAAGLREHFTKEITLPAVTSGDTELLDQEQQ